MSSEATCPSATNSDSKGSPLQLPPQPILTQDNPDGTSASCPAQDPNSALFPADSPVQAAMSLSAQSSGAAPTEAGSLTAVPGDGTPSTAAASDAPSGYFDPAAHSIVGNWGTVLVYGFPNGDTALLRSIFARYGRIQRVYRGRRTLTFGVIYASLPDAELAWKTLNGLTFSHGPHSVEPPFVLELVLYGPEVPIQALFSPMEFVVDYDASVSQSASTLSSSSVSTSPTSSTSPSSSPPQINLPNNSASVPRQLHGSPLTANTQSMTAPLSSSSPAAQSAASIVAPPPLVSLGSVYDGSKKMQVNIASKKFGISEGYSVGDDSITGDEMSLIDGMHNLVLSEGSVSGSAVDGNVQRIPGISQPLPRMYSSPNYAIPSYGMHPSYGNINSMSGIPSMSNMNGMVNINGMNGMNGLNSMNGMNTPYSNPTIPNIYLKTQLQKQQLQQFQFQQQQKQQQQQMQQYLMINPSFPPPSQQQQSQQSQVFSSQPYPSTNNKRNWAPKWQQKQLVPTPQSQLRQKRACKGTIPGNVYSQQCVAGGQCQGQGCGKFGQPHVVSAKPKRRYDPSYLVNVVNGAVMDPRTTLMIRNIPNRYTQQMILESLDICLLGKYNFFYLPIDFQNQCNVGYAFINMTNIVYIPMLYEMFHNKGWKLFKSEKICEVTYARIQGLQNLVDHFKSSSLLSEEEEVRPIVMVNGKLVPFPVNANIMVRRVGDREIISL